MGLVQTVVPGAEPVLIAAVKAQLNISGTLDDVALTAFIAAARGRCESFTGRQLEVATWQWTTDGFDADCIYIPKAPLVSVVSIKYIDTDGDEQTVSSSTVYETDITPQPFGRVKPKDGQSWPSDVKGNTFETVEIEFTAGYSAIPAELTQAMLLMIGHWHNNRENTIAGTINRIPLAAEDLMTPFKTEWFG